MFAMAKLMEIETTEQNKVALYLFNSIKNNEKTIDICKQLFYNNA